MGHGPVGDADGKEGTWGCEEQAVRQRKEAARSEGGTSAAFVRGPVTPAFQEQEPGIA